MARSSSVTFEAVEQICFQLLSQGENPSFNLVYAELGNKGSSEIVQRYIDQWRRETGAAFFRQRSIPGMPDELISATDSFMSKMWSLSLQQADQILAAQRQDLEQEREALRQRFQEADDRIRQLEAVGATASRQIALLEQEVGSRDSTISDLRSQALEFLRQREGLENRVRQLEEAAEARVHEVLRDVPVERRDRRCVEEPSLGGVQQFRALRAVRRATVGAKRRRSHGGISAAGQGLRGTQEGRRGCGRGGGRAFR